MAKSRICHFCAGDHFYDGRPNFLLMISCSFIIFFDWARKVYFEKTYRDRCEKIGNNIGNVLIHL